MNRSADPNEPITVITPPSGWQVIDFKELIEDRNILYYLVWRDIKSLYAQSILGIFWAILQPVVQIVVFTIVFGKIAKLSTDGIPYVLFSTVAIIPWNYISSALSKSSTSLIANQGVLGKVYFARLIFPLTGVLSQLLNFGISLVIVLGILIYYGIVPTSNLLFFPLFLVLMMCVPSGIGICSSALAIRFRDVRHAMPFLVRMLMYSAPIVYSASTIPEKYRIIYSFNPIVSVIEGYRACFLGTPMPWPYIWPGALTAVILVIFGALYFRRMEGVFVDVI